jgi:hypothetical protein
MRAAVVRRGTTLSVGRCGVTGRQQRGGYMVWARSRQSALWRGRGGGRRMQAVAAVESGAAGGRATRGGLVPSQRCWRGRAAWDGGQILMAQIWALRAPSGPGRVCLLSVNDKLCELVVVVRHDA